MKLQQGQHLTIYDRGEYLQLHQGIGDSTAKKSKKQSPLTDIHVPADTQLNYFINWDSGNIDRELCIHLDAQGAHAELIGIFIASKSHKIHLNSTIAHHASDTTGNCLVKGVLHDQSQASLSGMIQIDHLANNSYDQLTERLLVLSPEAQGQLQPELEILTNDVKASHATTISRPDEEQLFYLKSRGLNKNAAQELLIQGFLQEVLSIFPECITGQKFAK